MNNYIGQFQVDLRQNSSNPFKEWSDASEYFLSMRSSDAVKEAAPIGQGVKEFGKDLALGAGVGASIGAIRATGVKKKDETIGNKLKRIGSESADKAVEGTIQGLAVHGIRKFVKAASPWSDLGANAMKTVHSGGKAVKDAVVPHLSNAADFVAKKTVENPGAVGAIAGGTLGAGLASGATYDSPEAAMGGAAIGGVAGAKYGPGLATKAMDATSPLLGHGFRGRMMKVAVPLGMMGGIGKGLATSKAAIPLATAGLGGLASKATGGDFTTGAMAGGALGLAGRGGIVKALGSKQNPLLGGGLARGVRTGMREMSAAKGVANAAKPMGTGLANAAENVAKAPIKAPTSGASVMGGASRPAVPSTPPTASLRSTGSSAVNATPAGQVASAPKPPPTPQAAMSAKPAPVQEDSLQSLAARHVPVTGPVPKPAASAAAPASVPTSIPSAPSNAAQTINGIKVPESGFSGTEMSSLNLTGTPKPTMMDTMRQNVTSGKARVQQAYNNRFNKVNWNDPKMNNTMQLIETAQGNPRALAGIVNNLDQKTVNQLTRMGVI